MTYLGYASHSLSADDPIGGARPFSGAAMLRHIDLTGATVPGFMPVSPNAILRANHAIHRAGWITLADLSNRLSVSLAEAEAAVIWSQKFDFVHRAATKVSR